MVTGVILGGLEDRLLVVVEERMTLLIALLLHGRVEHQFAFRVDALFAFFVKHRGRREHDDFGRAAVDLLFLLGEDAERLAGRSRGRSGLGLRLGRVRRASRYGGRRRRCGSSGGRRRCCRRYSSIGSWRSCRLISGGRSGS
jgi:hypothetical protein